MRIQQRENHLRELGIIEAKNAPHFVLVGEDGLLTEEAKTNVGLTAAQAEEIQGVVDQAFAKVAAIVEKQTRYDPSASDPKKGVYNYKINSFKESGETIIQELQQDLGRIHPAKSELLASAFNPAIYAMGFGKYQADITTVKDISSEAQSISKASYNFADPTSGMLIRRGETTPRFFKKYFGSTLEQLPTPPAETAVTPELRWRAREPR